LLPRKSLKKQLSKAEANADAGRRERRYAVS
jgi:hypothetical protein